MLVEETNLEQLPAAAEYKVLNRIGQGAFGEVGSDQTQNKACRAHPRCDIICKLVQVLKALHRPSGQVRALKRVFNRKPQLGHTDNTLREFQALRSLQHCNVVRLLETYAQVDAL